MQKSLLSFTIALALLLASAPAFSAAKEGIAAIVNDSVITMTDIKDRAKLYLSASKETPSAEQRQKVEQQVLNRLIDETLQIQEAHKLGITIGEDEITAGFADISRQNGVTPDEFRKRLAAAGAHVDTLYSQIRADIAWSQVVRRKLRPQINISESEIDLTLNQMENVKEKNQYQVAEIFLNVANPVREKDTQDEAEKLVKQITAGASFGNVAREFSQAPGAATGGDLGWVQEGQLDPALDRALAKMNPGQISSPIRSDKGYHILFLRDVRQSTSPAAAEADTASSPVVSLKQILIPVTAQDPANVVAAKMMRGKSLREEIKSCDEMDKRMKDFPSPGTLDLGQGPQNNLPAAIRPVVENLQVGELSEPIRTPPGLAMIMVCAREEAPAPAETAASATQMPKLSPKNDIVSREKVANKIGTERLVQMATRYLRDLRATAFIDKRI